VLAPCNFNISFERFGCPPWGLAGGLPGAPACAEVETAKGTQPVRKVSQRPLAAGDRVYLHTGGGGGYGSPEQRDLALVEADLRAGYITNDPQLGLPPTLRTDRQAMRLSRVNEL
jgi:N-methylhydantoinase B